MSYRFRLSLVREEAPEPFGSQVTSPADAGALASRLLANEFQEVSIAMFFNRQHQLSGFIEVGRGGIAQCPMEPREILVAAFAANAAAIIVAHNHPSGNLVPSSADQAITQRLQRACDLVGLDLLDHLIVAAGGSVHSMLHAP